MKVNNVLNLLRQPRYLALSAGLGIAFFALYTFFDLREGGRDSNLTTTRLGTPEFYIEAFGAPFFYGSVVLNVALSVLSAILVALSIALYRKRQAFAGAACSTAAPVLLGFAVCGCPGCVMPIAGSLGATFFATSLPLFGLEFKVASLLVVVGALFWMSRRIAKVENGPEAYQQPTPAS